MVGEMGGKGRNFTPVGTLVKDVTKMWEARG
jgi:hypothetical protein